MTDRPVVPSEWPDLAGRIEDRVHRFPIRIYYEDTDFSGVVYYANYLRYCERGRSDYLRLIGVEHHKLYDALEATDRLGFAIKDLVSSFVKPARIDDVIEVHTRFIAVKGARFELGQDIYRQDDLLFSATLTAVVIDGNGRPRRLPVDMKQKFCELVIAKS